MLRGRQRACGAARAEKSLNAEGGSAFKDLLGGGQHLRICRGVEGGQHLRICGGCEVPAFF